MLISISKQTGDPWSQSRSKKKKGYGGKDLGKREVISLE